MSELKTLNGLEPMEERFVYRNELKAEAVKWVKHFEGKGKERYGKDFVPMNLWRHFFNLTSEDLK